MDRKTSTGNVAFISGFIIFSGVQNVGLLIHVEEKAETPQDEKPIEYKRRGNPSS